MCSAKDLFLFLSQIFDMGWGLCIGDLLSGMDNYQEGGPLIAILWSIVIIHGTFIVVFWLV